MSKKIIKLYKNPYKIVSHFGGTKVLNLLPDRLYLKLIYKAEMGKKLNLQKPITFNEKLQWLKINDRNPLYTNLVDKYEVRYYVEQILGKKYIIPLLNLYNSFDEIDFNKLPKQFVLKCTHDSGGVVICRDKNSFNVKMAKEIINRSLKRNYYYWGREWPYKNIKPRIICEEIIKTDNGKAPIDYKFHCFNGEPDNVMLCIGRETNNTKFYFFSEDWKLLRYNKSGINAPNDFTLPKPKMMNEMFDIARKLSSGLPFVRVDLYCENDIIYFGELTFFPESGFDSNLLESTDILFGNKIDINSVKMKWKS